MLLSLRCSIVAISLALTASIASGVDVPYGVPQKTWDIQFGHHRGRIQVSQPADAARVHLPWRRRDHDAASKNILVVDATTCQRVRNVVRIEVNREYADLVFQPKTVPGEYYVYYLPYIVQTGCGGYSGGYLPAENTADAEWVKRNHVKADELANGDWRRLPEAKVLEFQARTDFDSFYPMEVVATAQEVKTFRAQHAAEPYLLFPEDRRLPIRMRDDLPKRWIDRGPARTFAGEAQRNEYYAWQIGLYASKQPLDDLQVTFSDLQPATGGKPIPGTALKCFNLGGVDAYGKPFQKKLDVAQGKVQPLWIGVDVPADVPAGAYRGVVAIHPQNGPSAEVSFSLTIRPEVLADRGDSELWRHSRLRWLDSTLGIDDDVVAPYTPLTINDRTIGCLGRDVRFGDDGLPQNIRSGDHQVLAAPMRFVLEGDAGPLALTGGNPKITKRTPGTVVWESQSTGGSVSLDCRATMEFDGRLQYELAVRANKAIALKDIRLELPLNRDAATYMIGMGRPGGYRPKSYAWKWGGPQDSFWIGGVHAGVHCELRGATYCGPLLSGYCPAPPSSWHNEGRGGCSIAEPDASRVLAQAHSGKRTLAAGQTIVFEFALLITPVKPLDTAKHFRERYYHGFPAATPDDRSSRDINIINIHHGNEANPYINYPFAAVPQMSAFINTWQQRGKKVKIYYTVREVSDYVTELWALRSLGAEVLSSGPGGGFPWMREHLADDYVVSWYQPLGDGLVDASVGTAGESRWCNYYVQGLEWLTKNLRIDGLYLDDVSYDRRILKRIRKVLDRNRPGSMIDLHSNACVVGSANQYAEFFPYLDRLWFGESVNYEAMSPDAWLVEVSGIPFGLMGDMLQNGGNPWRGMVYGMTNRLPWPSGPIAEPRPIWKLWDEFGIADSKMIGYWEKNCPVKTDNKDVLATAYVRDDKTLVAIASWAPQPVTCRLSFDCKTLRLDLAKAKLSATAIENFQPMAEFHPDDHIPIQPGRGWLLVVQK